jgi:hypothetical protein
MGDVVTLSIRTHLAAEIRAIDTTGVITRRMVETVLDFHIDLEGSPWTAHDNDLEFDELQVRYRSVIGKGTEVLKAYAQQLPASFDAMQNEFYSFTTSPKYARTIVTAGVARSILRQAWDGINGFRA